MQGPKGNSLTSTLQLISHYKEAFCLSHFGGKTSSIFPSAIKASSSIQFLHFGLQLHCVSIKTAFISDTVTANSLLSMYSKCSDIKAAAQVFDTIPQRVRDVVTWSSMINSCIENGDGVEAVAKYKQMYLCGFEPKDELIARIVSVYKRVGGIVGLRLGRQLHAHILCTGRITTTYQSVYLATAMLDLYSKCFDLNAACKIFDSMDSKDKNKVSWTAMIGGSCSNQCYDMSLNFFRAMNVGGGTKANRVTLIAVLPACAELGSLKHGKEIHGYAFHHSYESESHLAAALIDMYCKCGQVVEYASLVFERSKERDVVMWSSMIKNYAQCGNSIKAITLFNQMRMKGIEPNSVTLLGVITSYAMNHGEVVHGYIVKTGWESDLFIGNALIDMYAKYGLLNDAQQIFDAIPVRDYVSWSTLIRGYGLYGYGVRALQIFQEMQEKQIEPDEITFLAVLSACNHSGLIKEGQNLFEGMRQNNKIDLTVEHYACYIDLLGRHGNIDDALKVIRSMPMKPIPSMWSCLVSACKSQGRMDVAEIVINRLIDTEPENAAHYTLLRTVYAEMGDWRRVEEVEREKGMKGMHKSYGYSRLELLEKL